MKLFQYVFLAISLCCLTACEDDDVNSYASYQVEVTLVNPQTETTVSDVEVTLTSSTGSSWQSTTDTTGVAIFQVSAGLYSLSASTQYTDDNDITYYLNVSASDLIVSSDNCTDGVLSCSYTFTATRGGSLVIKELYNGGCQKDDGSGAYNFDKYCTLYNNGQTTLTLANLALGMASPYNAQATGGANYDESGNLTYASEGFIPAIQAIWYFPDTIVLEANEEITIAINGAIDHTVSYSNSVDLSKEEYYCTYDPTVFSSTTYYPVPSTNISEDHYWKAIFYGMGTAWPLSVTSPAFFVWQTPDSITPQEYASDESNVFYSGGTESAVYACRKIPTEWVLDAVEVFTTSSTENRKRLTDEVDAGAVYLTNKYGYTLYRCVDTDATLAIDGNADKLIYSMPSTSDSSTYVVVTDPAGIDAEASLANGAVIIYKDTNNSSNDFFERYQAALRD